MSLDLSAESWGALSHDHRLSTAHRLARQLPAGFTFSGLDGPRASFSFGDAVFFLVPGGEFAIGFDAGAAPEPTPAELRSWKSSAREYKLRGTFREFVASATLPRRTFALPPMLVEAEARDLCYAPIDAADPVVARLAAENPETDELTVWLGDGISYRITRDPAGNVHAERAVPITHAEIVRRLSEAGFQLPAPDEWEYLCGAGAPSLFHWGDHVPCDRYPTDTVSARKQPFDAHRRPNALGLSIARTPYLQELTSDPGVVRGGDGGSAVCGGVGFFLGWLPLATAYFEDETCRRDPNEPVDAEYTVGRRVLPLA